MKQVYPHLTMHAAVDVFWALEVWTLVIRAYDSCILVWVSLGACAKANFRNNLFTYSHTNNAITHTHRHQYYQ
jgi:hypothetical protein